MKMVYCIFNVSVAEEMRKILDKVDAQNYQIIDNVLAKTENSDPRFNTPVWPGFDRVATIQMEEISELVAEIKAYNSSEEDANEQILVYAWDIEKLDV